MAQPPPASLDDAPMMPDLQAGWLSILTFGWIYPILATGYARPLETTDLWNLDTARSSRFFADKIDQSYARRVSEASDYNKRLADGEIQPGTWKKIVWTVKGDREAKEKEWRTVSGKRKPSLARALKYDLFCSLLATFLTRQIIAILSNGGIGAA